MSRALLGEEFEAGISCADCQALQHPAVIASDWFGFLCLSLSALALMYKYSTFKGPNQDDAYYFGYHLQFYLLLCARNLSGSRRRLMNWCNHATRAWQVS
jgi:hypothetical protein